MFPHRLTDKSAFDIAHPASTDQGSDSPNNSHAKIAVSPGTTYIALVKRVTEPVRSK